MSRLVHAKIFLKSGQTVEFQTSNLKITGSSLSWDRPSNARAAKLLHVDFEQIAAVTYE